MEKPTQECRSAHCECEPDKCGAGRVDKRAEAAASGLSDDVRAEIEAACRSKLVKMGDDFELGAHALATRILAILTRAMTAAKPSKCSLGCAAECKAELHGCPSECPSPVTRHAIKAAQQQAEPSAANTLAGFQGACAVNGRLPTEQEIWDAGVRSGMRRAEVAQQGEKR